MASSFLVFATRQRTWGLWRRDRVFWAIFGCALLLGLAYNAVILPGFGPDEPRHLAYVRLLFEEHRFPLQLPNGSEYGGAHSYHPPAYYVLLVPFYAIGRSLPGESVWHLLRLVSLGLCLAALPLIYDIAWRAGSFVSRDDEARAAIARFTVAGVALLPIWGMTGGIINNDCALVLCVAAFVWLLCVRFSNDFSWKSAFWLGLVFGLGALSKATAVLCDGAALLGFCWLGTRAHRAAKTPGRAFLWARAGAALALGIVIAAPWYVRNAALYGTFQPVPSGFTNPALPAPSNGMLVMAMHPHFPALFEQANWGIFYTLWSQRDWILQQKSPFPIAPLNPTQNALYLSLTSLVAFAALGHLRRPRTKPNGNASPATANTTGEIVNTTSASLNSTHENTNATGENTNATPANSNATFDNTSSTQENTNSTGKNVKTTTEKTDVAPANANATASKADVTLANTSATRQNVDATLASATEELDSKRAVAVSYATFGVAWLACLQVALFVHWGQAEGGRYLLPDFSG